MVRSILWNGRTRYGTNSSRQRHDHARRQSSNTSRSQVEDLPAIGSRAGLRARAAEPGDGGQSQDRCEMAQALDGRGYKDGHSKPRSTVLSEAMVVAFRRPTLLPLDDYLHALQPSISHLTRSALHRCPAGGMASRACLIWRVTSRSGRSSNATRSASSTSTSLRCRPLKANYICSSASTARASSP